MEIGHLRDHRAVLHAGETGHQRRRELFRVKVGHSGVDEIRDPRAWSIQHHCQCTCTRSRWYRVDAEYPAAASRHGSGWTHPSRSSDTTTGMGRTGAQRSTGRRLAAASRHLTCSRFPGVGRCRHGDGCRIRGDGWGQCEECVGDVDVTKPQSDGRQPTELNRQTPFDVRQHVLVKRMNWKRS